MNEDELDRRLDDELRAAFAPPPDRDLAAVAQRVARPRGTVLRRWPWVLLAAAGLLLAALFAPAFLQRSQTSAPASDESLGRAWVAAYESAEQQGFGDSCCSPGFDMGAACQGKFACCLGVAAGGSLAVVGGYSGKVPSECMTLLARDGELPMCVFVMHKAKDRPVRLPRGSDLHLARRELGDLVLYALADAPPDRALAQFVLP
ncbi:MAG: hypothetical protein U1E73_03750 [Planctomycetota bacterium]